MHIYRNAKVYLYNEDGKRDKSQLPIYKFTKKDGFSIPIYGAHLIPDAGKSNINKIAVVESEKTAIIASAFFKNTIWLASGGAQMLTDERCKKLAYYSRLLSNSPIHLFADADIAGRKSFSNAYENLRKRGTHVVYHDLYPERDDGWDIADEILQREIVE